MDYELAGSVILSGLTIVFVVLILLTLIVDVLGKVLGGVGKKADGGGKQEPEALVQEAPEQAAPVVEEGIPNETVAVISAAVTAALGGNCAVRGIQHAPAHHHGRGRRTAWGMAGMQQNTSPF